MGKWRRRSILVCPGAPRPDFVHGRDVPRPDLEPSRRVPVRPRYFGLPIARNSSSCQMALLRGSCDIVCSLALGCVRLVLWRRKEPDRPWTVQDPLNGAADTSDLDIAPGKCFPRHRARDFRRPRRGKSDLDIHITKTKAIRIRPMPRPPNQVEKGGRPSLHQGVGLLQMDQITSRQITIEIDWPG